MIMTAGTTIITMKILMTIPTTTTMTDEDCNDENIKHSTDNIMTIRPMKTLKVAIKITTKIKTITIMMTIIDENISHNNGDNDDKEENFEINDERRQLQ